MYDELALGTFVSPVWIIIGSVIGLHGLWKWPMSNKRKLSMFVYGSVTLFLAGLSWNYSIQQGLHEKISDEQASRSEKLLEKVTKSVKGLANDLQVPPNDDLKQTLAAISDRILGRRIRPEQAAAVKDILSRVGPKKFQISIEAQDRETLSFARQLDNVLLSAGWIPARDTGPFWGCQTGNSGIVISGRLSQSDPATANALLTAFSHLNVVINDDVNMNSCAPDGAVEIFVGKL